jgi:hypothetical protein
VTEASRFAASAKAKHERKDFCIHNRGIHQREDIYYARHFAADSQCIGALHSVHPIPLPNVCARAGEGGSGPFCAGPNLMVVWHAGAGRTQ